MVPGLLVCDGFASIASPPAIEFRSSYNSFRTCSFCPMFRRSWRARCKAEELRTEGLRKLRELEKMEQERAARRLELRRAGLSVLISRGAGLLGESFKHSQGNARRGDQR